MPTEALMPTAQELGRSVDIKKLFSDQLRDEFNNNDVEILKPKPLTIEGNEDLTKEFNDILEKDFAYYSRTNDLEVNTDRTRILQTAVDKMAAGRGIDTRIVIMKRGKASQAFVAPEGSIFISQSLLNKLDSIDEITAILAHELAHLINKTTLKVLEAGKGRFGVGWLHEAASDQLAPVLLEKAGFTSWAFATAIEKIQGYERGTIHQSGLARASQNVGQHLAIDRTTSSQEVTPLPEILKGKVIRTNQEIVMDRIKEEKEISDLMRGWQFHKVAGRQIPEKLTPLKDMLKQLHPRDLKTAYRKLIHEGYNNPLRREKETCDQIIRDRLEKAGYTTPQINLFLVRSHDDSSGSRSFRKEDAYMFKQVEDLTQAVDFLAGGEVDQTTRQMFQIVFDSPPEFANPTEIQLLNFIGSTMLDVNFENRVGLPVSRDSLLDSLEKISAMKPSVDNSIDYEYSIKYNCCIVLATYVSETFLALAEEAQTDLDENQLEEFFREIKTRGIKFDPDVFATHINTMATDIWGHPLINSEHKDKILTAVENVWEKEHFILTKESIDEFFKEFTDDKQNKNKRDLLNEFLIKAHDYFLRENVSDEQRLEFARYLSAKIDSRNFPSRTPWLKFLDNKDKFRDEEATKADGPANDAVFKLNLRLILGVVFFDQDSDQFYNFITEAMDKTHPDLGSLSRTQGINLYLPLLSADQSYFYGTLNFLSDRGWEHVGTSGRSVNIANHNRFFELPMIKRIMELEDRPDFTNLKDLNNYIRAEQNRYLLDSYQTKPLYGDGLFSLVTAGGARKNFKQIISRGIKDEDYGALADFLKRHFPDGSQKDEFLREIDKHYLKSTDVSLKEKIYYLQTNFNRVGPEGMILVAEQIGDIKSYRYFREKMAERLTKYLDGHELKAVNVAAGLDLIGSYFTNQFDKLLATCQGDPATAALLSTEVAGEWFKTMLYKTTPTAIDYNANLNKFVLTEAGRKTFRTLTDLFSSLKSSTDLQKFALIHKALTDQNGALTGPDNRKKLAAILLKSLGLKKGFLASVLSAACTRADAKLIGFPASIILTPLVFRALDISAVQLDKLKEEEIWIGSEHTPLSRILPEEAISEILHADTRSVSVFGAQYQNQPNSPAALLARESDQQFHTTTNILKKLLLQKGGEVLTGATSEIDPATEAVIRGVEKSGALGIRALQLTTQFYDFPPALGKRLSDAFDSNPGLNKMLFWENLNKLALDKAEKEDLSVEGYLQRITLGSYLGGGSLQTTYSAILDAGTPQERQVIIKLKNPNVQKFIEESYLSATRTLDMVVRQGGATAQHARTGLILLDLSQKWCLDDLNDKTFIEDDEGFREVITDFNRNESSTIFYAPEKVFTSPQMKSEDLAGGKTANQFLKDQSVNFAQKQEVVRALSRFFIHQLKRQASLEEGGKKLRLIHSDPHIGNYMVDTASGQIKVGVIDRSMYLKLEDADMKVLEKLMLPGNDSEFVYGFIDRVLDINKVRGIQRSVITSYVMLSVGTEYKRQQVKGHINRFDLMRTMISTLSDSKLFGHFSLKRMDIPLNLRLMIRNIGAFQELGKRYQIDFDALYREQAV